MCENITPKNKADSCLMGPKYSVKTPDDKHTVSKLVKRLLLGDFQIVLISAKSSAFWNKLKQVVK